MMDELTTLESIYKSQKRWKMISMLVFVVIIAISSVVFIVLSRAIPGIVIQVLMILCMFSIVGLVFLDRVSYQLNKKFFEKSVLHDNLFKHSKPEDMYTDADIMVELIKSRRASEKEKKKFSAKV